MNDDANQERIIEATADYVKNKLGGEGTGHDWFHAHRVWKTAKRIAEEEKADLFVVELAALLHDISDWKFSDGNEMAGAIESKNVLTGFGVDEDTISRVSDIVATISFKGAGVGDTITTMEGMAVQDADRIDAIGAIGIARTFAYGGKKDREIYNPDLAPAFYSTFEEYKNGKSSSINHFYEKLLLMKDRMNTKTGKAIAEQRHAFLELYLKQFFAEWDGLI